MNCCQSPLQDKVKDSTAVTDTWTADRRTVLKGLAGLALGLGLGLGRPGSAQDAKKIRLAFCSQLLCVVPYEATRAGGFFAAEGLDVELIYTRGGNAAMQALVGGAVDYAGTSFDVALQAFARNAAIRRFATTGRLPLFALAVAPQAVAEITEIKDLENRTVGVSALGNADHALALYLLQQAGVDPSKVSFATLGTNLYHALRLGQVDAGMVQEPALSLLIEDGGVALMNAMDLEDAKRYLGGPYEFMGVAVRAEERDERLDEMRRLARALAKGLKYVQTAPVSDLIDALPSELIAGGDRAQLEGILSRYRSSLYPSDVTIDIEACRRVEQSQLAAGLLEEPVDLDTLLDREVLGG